MQSVADVAAEHARAFRMRCRARGVAVINADDDFAPFWRDVVERRNAEGDAISVLDFGLQAPAAHQRAAVAAKPGAASSCSTTPQGNVGVELQRAGRHNVRNALAAAAAALARGRSLAADARGPRGVPRRSPAGCSAKRGTRGSRGHRRHLQRQSGFGAGRDRGAGAGAPAARAWCSATWARSATQASRFHREIGEYARAPASTRC